MALQSFPFSNFSIVSSLLTAEIGSSSGTTLNAVGESLTLIGYIHLEGGSGSKTISSAGGKIWWRAGAVTFANAATNLRIGIQDVGATGIEDGTFDVRADLVPGTDTITASTVYATAMETGSKTINHGDLIAVSFEMTARGGTDSVSISSMYGGFMTLNNFPYATVDSGAGPARSQLLPSVTVEFDDGTLGWLSPFYLGYNFGNSPSNLSFNNGSTPDEYAAIFQIPFKSSINKAALYIGSVASTDNFEVVLYSDPLGTPVAQRTATINPNYTGSASLNGILWANFSSSYTIEPNTNYAVAVRPTTANSISLGYYDLGSGNSKLKRPTIFGENIKLAGRTNQTGGFSETQTYHLPIIWLGLDKFDDGVQTGGLKTHPGMHGGMRG